MLKFYNFKQAGFIFLAFLFAFSALHAQTPDTTLTPRSITTSDMSHGFYEYLPVGYESSNQTYPLLIMVHGLDEFGNGSSDLYKVLDNGIPQYILKHEFPASFSVNGHSYSFIIIIPQFTVWPDPMHVDSLINYLTANYKVNRNRVYFTGLSMGGGVVWGYAGSTPRFAEKLAAILPVAGAAHVGAGSASIISSAHLPVFATHNLNDPTVPVTYTTTNINMINSATPAPAIKAIDTIFDATGHDAWTETYNPQTLFFNSRMNVYQWLLQYSLDAVSEPLPVKLIDYTAALSADQASVNVDWTTSFEQNNNYFILQRSANGQQFYDLDTIPAAAQQGQGYAYSYMDSHPLPGANFYRLTQVDKDNKTTYFDVLKVSTASGSAPAFHISPNPSAGPVYLEMENALTGALQVRLTDVQGKVLRNWSFQKQTTIWTQNIETGNLPPGSYFITVTGNGVKEIRTLVRR
jgi:pimeloyl-ACP methyl ester carboxylesterase